MNFNIQYIDVPNKWRNYKKYIGLIQDSAFSVLKNDELLKTFSIILVNNEEIHRLNLLYRQKDRATDVLTFIDDEEADYLGDIFLNVEAVEIQAKEYGHSLKREFCFLVTHGLLHLIGYDHQDEKSEKEMFEHQERILMKIAPRR